MASRLERQAILNQPQLGAWVPNVNGIGGFVRIHLKRPSAAMVVACISLFVALSGATYAATGGSLILGHGNSADAQTALTARLAHRSVLRVQNLSTGSGAFGLGIEVRAGRQPIHVNGVAGKAVNLNADKVDGKNAKDFLALSAPAGRLVAEGLVNSAGVLSGAAGAGVIASRSGTGSYSITAPGINPGCAAAGPNILATPFGGAEISITLISTLCASGDATVSLQARNSAGAAQDSFFYFAIFNGNPVTASPAARIGNNHPSVCVMDANGKRCH